MEEIPNLKINHWKLVAMMAVEQKEGGKTSAYGVLKETSWCLDVPCPGPGCMIKSSPSELVLVWKNV